MYNAQNHYIKQNLEAENISKNKKPRLKSHERAIVETEREEKRRHSVRKKHLKETE